MRTTTVKDQNTIDNILGHIDHFENEHWYSISTNEDVINNNHVAKLWKEDGKFCVQFAVTNLLNQRQIEQIGNNRNFEVELRSGLYDINIKYDWFSDFSISAALGYGYTSIKGILKQFSTNHFSNDSEEKFLTVIKCKQDNVIRNNFLGGSFIPANDLKIGNVTYGSRLLEIFIEEKLIECYLYGRENINEKYLFIESTTTINFSVFRSIVHEFLLCINYLTGNNIGDEIYTLRNTNSRGDRHDMHRIVSYEINPEKLAIGGFETIPKLNYNISEHNILQLTNGTNFLANMIQECLKAPAYKRTLLLMAQASKQPDYIRVIQYSVALESISKLFYEKNEAKMNPISDRSLSKLIRKSLKNELEKFKDEISIESFEKLNNYIDRINSPTNSDMLTKPFELLNIQLNEEELEAIKKRNDFLHGRLPADPGSHNLAIIGFHLHYCVNILILKYLGYKGAVIRQAVLYKRAHAIINNLEAYQII